jgi:hypothetical protein
MKALGKVNWKVISTSAEMIDKIGISKCIYKSIKNNISGFGVNKRDVKLDGALPKSSSARGSG